MKIHIIFQQMYSKEFKKNQSNLEFLKDQKNLLLFYEKNSEKRKSDFINRISKEYGKEVAKELKDEVNDIFLKKLRSKNESK